MEVDRLICGGFIPTWCIKSEKSSICRPNTVNCFGFSSKLVWFRVVKTKMMFMAFGLNVRLKKERVIYSCFYMINLGALIR